MNADLIAAGLSPLAPESELLAAGKLFLKEVRACVARRQDFGLETTLAGRSYLKLIDELHADGWRVELIYLALPNKRMSHMRVAERVAHGGHGIPAVDIERRFSRSLRNLLNFFGAKADVCRCFMNSGPVPELVFEQQAHQRNVLHTQHYQLLLQESKA